MTPTAANRRFDSKPLPKRFKRYGDVSPEIWQRVSRSAARPKDAPKSRAYFVIDVSFRVEAPFRDEHYPVRCFSHFAIVLFQPTLPRRKVLDRATQPSFSLDDERKRE